MRVDVLRSMAKGGDLPELLEFPADVDRVVSQIEVDQSHAGVQAPRKTHFRRVSVGRRCHSGLGP